MIAYEFYFRDEKGGVHLVGILPERRIKLERITNDSVLNWGWKMIGDHSDVNNIFYVRIEM
jgi:hypothetical protein